MGQTQDSIDPATADWIARQAVFFVGTAPLSGAGHVNVSPKGGDTLRVLGPREIAWLDGAGSGIETISHLRENGRIVVMWCAFEGPPRILRCHGRGEVVDAADPRFAALLARFPPYPSARAIIRVEVGRIAGSCGYGVPRMDLVAERGDSAAYVAKASDQAIHRYLQDNNRASIDGLPGLAPEAIDAVRIDRSAGRAGA
ncbi:MAG: pyridoxamine 5'-phosphate oxidase family protein [Gammaproteobacteria bacterium]|nr:pyridoxamine 5'-phosphate oxidase family protein [Gammaproteobacteria bacterium]